MTEKHPYISSIGSLVQLTKHLRNSFPMTVTADTLKKLGLAPKNESYALNILRFLNVIDTEGKRMAQAQKVFALHEDIEFKKQFSELVQSSYKDLFELHGNNSWNLSMDQLISFFRTSDHTSAIIGKRQANTFLALAALSGHREAPEIKTQKVKTIKKGIEKPDNVKTAPDKGTRTEPISPPLNEKRNLGLTVRIEINLPADGDQETYDRIFKSIRENLLNE